MNAEDITRKKAAEAANNVVSRLRQMRQLWEDAANAYFHPERFQIALQNCITTSRTVTFILQSNKRAINGFDDWYSPYVEKWRNDPVMRWAVEARNTIEKKGDLKTFSQVKGRIIASYLGGPSTDWLPQFLFASPQHILRGIPAKYFAVPQVKENGTLVIERRWVDSALPDIEVLDALARVYTEFAELLVELFGKIGVEVPPEVADTRPQAMQPLTMDRAIYLSIKDGSETGFRFFQKTTQIDQKALKRRYKNAVGWKELNKARTFRETCDVFFKNARAIMIRDHHHRSFALLFKGVGMIEIVAMDHPDRASRYVIVRELAALAKIVGADGVMLIAEAWMAKAEDLPPSGYAVDAKNRSEALIMGAANSKGRCFHYQAQIERKKIKKHKVKRLLPTDFAEERFQFILSPFQKVWGCLDMAEVQKALAQMDEMGIERSYDTMPTEPAPQESDTSDVPEDNI